MIEERDFEEVPEVVEKVNNIQTVQNSLDSRRKKI